MSEFLFDESPVRREFIRPDDEGFTLETYYKGTQGVLDRNAELRAAAPSTFREGKHTFHHVGSVPIEVYEQFYLKLGREPTAQELITLINEREFCRLKTRDVKL